MSEINFSELRRVKNTTELAGWLRELDRSKVVVSQNLFLTNLLEKVFESGGFRVDLRKGSLTEVAKRIEGLDSSGAEKIRKMLVESMGEIDDATEKSLSNSVVPTAQLEQILKEYEEHLRNGTNPGDALNKVAEDNKGLVARAQIENLIKVQSETYQKIIEELRELSATELDEVVVEELAHQASIEVAISQTELGRELGLNRQVIPEVIANKITEELNEVVVERIVESNIPSKDFELQIEKVIEGVNQETTKQILRQYANETRERINVTVDVGKRTIEATNDLLTEVKASDPILAKVIEKNEVAIRKSIANRISQAIIRDVTVDVQEVVGEALVKETGNTELIQKQEIAIRTFELRVTKLTVGNNELQNVRSDWLERSIMDGFVAENNRERVASNWQEIQNFSKLISKIYYPSSGREIEPFKQEALEFSKSRGISAGRSSEAWNEMKGLATVLRMKPGEFSNFISTYKNSRDKIARLNLPFNVGKLRATENLIKAFESSPGTRNFLIYAQKYIALNNSINNLGASILTKIGFKDAGMKLMGKIGGQAMAEFTRHSLAVMAEHGTATGVKLILKGIVTGGVKAGAAGAGASGGVAAAVAAFQSIPVVGQVVLVLAGAALLVKSVVSPIFKKISKLLKSLNLDLGISRFTKENFGGFVGGILNVGVKAGMLLVGLPALITGASIAAIIVPFLILFFAVFSIYQIFYIPNIISSIVPPRSDVSGRGGDGSAYVIAEPIYVEDCQSSPACAIIEHILHDLGYERSVGKNTDKYKRNVDEIAIKLRSWEKTFPNFPNFNLNSFVNIMISNSTSNSSGRPYFQCLGFSLAIDSKLPKGREISHYMNNNHPGCVSINPEDAGAGDHIMYRAPHIMILSVLSSPDEYGKKSCVISDVNYDYEGGFRNRYFPDFVDFYNNLKSSKGDIKILRCQ